MHVDLATSTVTLADRRLPAVGLLCPPHEGDGEPAVQRLLGGPARGLSSYQVFVPCENGLLVTLEWSESDPDVYQVYLHARTCELYEINDEPLWLPHSVGFGGGQFVVLDRSNLTKVAWAWFGAEPEWVVEHVDRVSRRHFTQPPGPVCRLLRLAESEELLRSLPTPQ